jgi:hypothetical protein
MTTRVLDAVGFCAALVALFTFGLPAAVMVTHVFTVLTVAIAGR